jgi:hypothetical protein
VTAVEVFHEMRARGGRFVVDGGKLRPRAPAGVNVEDLKAAAQPVRAELVDLVEGRRCWDCGEAKTVLFVQAAAPGEPEPRVCGGGACARGER